MIFMKWADFGISKISFKENNSTIDKALVHIDNGETIATGYEKDRSWMVQQIQNGKTFCTITKTKDGKWAKKSYVQFGANGFNGHQGLPKLATKRKTFVSFYHTDDEQYRKAFDNLFGDLVVHKSVNDGDIDSKVSDEYIKQLIQKGYLSDTTVLVVLVGPKTKCRKHIDWEISAALNVKVGDNYSGVLGLLLPTHNDYGKTTYDPAKLPTRLAKNVGSGYAVLCDWTDDPVKLQQYIEQAFAKRKESDKIVNKAIPQMSENTCN
jgi:hypothetical protein